MSVLLYLPSSASFFLASSEPNLSQISGKLPDLAVETGSIQRVSPGLIKFKGRVTVDDSITNRPVDPVDILCSECGAVVFGQKRIIEHVTEEDRELFDAWSCHKETFKVFEYLGQPGPGAAFFRHGAVLVLDDVRSCPGCRSVISKDPQGWVDSSCVRVDAFTVTLYEQMRRLIEHSSCFHFRLVSLDGRSMKLRVLSHAAYVCGPADVSLRPCLLVAEEADEEGSAAEIKVNDLLMVEKWLADNRIDSLGSYLTIQER